MAKDILYGSDDELIQEASKAGTLNEMNRLGMFTPNSRPISEYMPQHDVSWFQQQIANYAQLKSEENFAIRQAEDKQKAALLAEQKRQQLAEANRLKELKGYRKDPLLKNPDGTLKQDSDLELWLKQKLNSGIELLNSANDYVPDAIAKDKTLDIDWRATGTVAGMAHENLQNKDFSVGTDAKSKKQVLNEVAQLQDDPQGKGTLYYLRKNIGTEENPEYLYKVGFAALNAADRYRGQANAAGWDIVDERQSSGAADLEKKIQTAFIGDRALSYGEVKGKDGKITSHDKASGINFGSGYGEIYTKDILGLDKKSTAADLRKYKVEALKGAAAGGLTGEQLKAYRTTLDAITPAQLDRIKLDDNKARSYAERDARDAYRYGRDDDTWTSVKAGLNKFGRETVDDVLDIVTPAGMTQESMLGQWLRSDGQGNSTRLDEWKSQESADKYIGYDRKLADETTNAVVYHAKQGNWTGVLSNVFSKGGLNVTAESLGYMAPMLVPAFFSGGTSMIAQGGMKVKQAVTLLEEANAIKNSVAATGNLAKAAEAATKITSAEATIMSETAAIGDKLANAAKFAERFGFATQSAVMTNERIDARIANNGGQPTSIFENAMVFAETVVENAVDKLTDMAVLGAGGRKELQAVYKLLDDNAKRNIYTKVAAKAVALAASAGVEGATEYLQGIGETFAEQYDTKKNEGTIAGILNSSENQEAGIVNFLMGAAGGAHMQAVPSGIGLGVDVIGKGWDKVSGKQGLEEARVRQGELATAIVNGTANPHAGAVAIDGSKDPMAVTKDIYDIVTGEKALPAQMAQAAVFQAEGLDPTGAGGEKLDFKATLSNIDKTLRTTYNIAEDGTGSESDRLKYDHAMYRSAMQTLKHVNDFQSDNKESNAKAGITVNDTSVNDAFNTVMTTYKEVLPRETMDKIVMLTAQSMLNSFKKSVADSHLQNSKVSDLVSQDADGSYSINVDMLKSSVAKMDSMIMGSSGTGGGSGTFDGEAAIASLQRTKAIMEQALKKASGGKAKLSPEFFDQMKSASDVSGEVLFSGKTDNDSGKTYGKGVYQHGEDVLRSVMMASEKKTGTKSAIDLGAINSFKSFAMKRVKPRSVANLKAKGGYFSKAEIMGTRDSDGRYDANYIPEMDRSGLTARQKIIESNHVISVAKSTMLAVENAEGVNAEHKKKILADLQEIITKSEKDKVELTAIMKGLQGDTNKDGILINLRNSQKYYAKKVKAGVASKSDKANLADIEAQIAEAMAIEGKFTDMSPIYAFVKPYSGLKRINDDLSVDGGTRSDVEQDIEEDDRWAGIDLNEQDTGGSTKQEEASAKSEDKATESDNATTKPSEPQTKEKDTVDGQDSETDRQREKQTSGESSAENKNPKSDQQRAGKTSRRSEENQELEDADSKSVTDSERDKSDVIIAAEKELDALYDRETELYQEILDYLGLDGTDIKGKGLKNRLAFIKKAITAKQKSNIESLKTLDKLDKLYILREKETARDMKAKVDQISKSTAAAEINSKQKVINALRDKLLDGYVGVADIDGKKTYKLMVTSDPEVSKAIGYLNRLNKIINGIDHNVFTAPKKPKKRSRYEPGPGESEEAPAGYSTWDESQAPSGSADDYSPDMYEEGFGENGEIDPAMFEDPVATEESVEPQESVIVEDEADPVNHEESLEEQTEDTTDSDAAKAADPKINIFAIAAEGEGVSKLQLVNKSIADLKTEMKKAEDAAIAKKVKELRAKWIKEHGGAIIPTSKDNNVSKQLEAEAKAIVKNEMEKC